MQDHSKDFEDFGDKIWLNAASEGPLPKVAAQALKESIIWKSLPYQLDNAKFAGVPKDLKASIGKLIGVSDKDVILANSASYGVHLVANGLKWSKGDEVVLMQNDFPTDILPWLALEKQGVRVIQLKAQGAVLTPEEFRACINNRTKLLCLPHVHTFSGIKLDIDGFSRICREKGILFVVNISQSAGAMPVNLSDWHVDCAVCAGYKWLLGPYGTGFAWIRPELREQLDINLSYWISALSADELKSEGAIEYRDLKSARKLDVFGTANFFNFVPFRASIEYLLNIGIENIWQYHQKLGDFMIKNLPYQHYDLLSPKEPQSRSSLTVISHMDPQKNKEIYTTLMESGIYTALWKGKIRLAPHIYNTVSQLQRLVEHLERLS